MENYTDFLKDEIATLKKMIAMLEKRNEILEKEIEELKQAKSEKQVVEHHYYYHYDYSPYHWTYPYITCTSTNSELNSSTTVNPYPNITTSTSGTAFINNSTCSKC